MKEWEKVAATVVANYVTRPFDTHTTHVNFYRVDLVSKESGLESIDGAMVDTPLGGAVRPAGAGKLLACDVKKTARLAREMFPVFRTLGAERETVAALRLYSFKRPWVSSFNRVFMARLYFLDSSASSFPAVGSAF